MTEQDDGAMAGAGGQDAHRREVIRRAVLRIHRRLRIQSSMDTLTRGLPAIGALGSLLLLFRADFPELGRALVLALCLALSGLAWALGRRRAPSELCAALRLDQALGRHGQLAAAYDFSQESRTKSPFSELVIDSEASALPQLDLDQTLSLHRPRGWPLALVCLAALGASLAFQPQPDPPAPLTTRQTKTDEQPEPTLSDSELAFLEREAQEALEAATSEDGRRVSEELLELISELSGGLSREEAQRRVAAMWAEVERRGEEAQSFSQELDDRGHELQASKLGRPLAEALREGRLKDAGEALRTLAERLADEKNPPSKKELDELREAIAKAQEKKAAEKEDKTGAQAEDTQSSAERQLRDKRDRLLEKKQSGHLTPKEAQELERAERELKRLDRRKKQEQKTLSELDRALADAAREIEKLRSEAQKRQSQSGEGEKRKSFDQAADSLESQSSRELSDEEKKELLEQLKRLKERLRQAEKDGEMQKRLEQFEKQARGQKPGGEGKPGAPEMGNGSRSVEIDVPAGSPSAAQPGSGKEPGSAHDPNLTGEADKRIEAEAKAAQAAAQDSGEGESASETIRTAAEQGFTKASYERIYTEYRTVQEEMMEEESIPAGQKRSVQRYFELIRPRETERP